MKILFGHDASVLQWANKFFDHPLRATWALGIIDKRGVLKGALIGDELNPTTAELTICSDHVITPEIAKTFFGAVFSRYWRLQVRTAKNNKTIKRNAPKWGFIFEGTAKDYWGPGQHALCYRMTRDQCRWLGNEGKNGIVEAKDRNAA